MQTINITFQHGWAFSAHCWNPWFDAMNSLTSSSGNVLVQRAFAADRGYFGDLPIDGRCQNTPGVKGHGQPLNVIVTHSFGLHLITPVELARADIVCAFGSFLAFHPEGEVRARKSKRIITRMLEQFKTDPQSVMVEFLANCYHPCLPPEMGSSLEQQQANLALLEEDLKRLDNGVVPLKSLEAVKKIVLFHDEDDKIIPIEQAYAMRERLPNSTLILSSGAGHALPFARSEWAFSQLITTIENLLPFAGSSLTPYQVPYAW